MTQNDSQHAQNKQPTAQLIMSGDVNGTCGADTVVNIQNILVHNVAPSTGNFLTYSGSTTHWEPLTQAAALILKITNVTSTTPYSVASTDTVIISNVGGATPTSILLPSSATQGRMIFFSNRSAGANVTITPFAGTVLNNSGSPQTISHAGCIVCYDGSNWQAVGNFV